MELKDLLDRALATVGGNQAELARRVGRSETTVSRWVTGRNGVDYESALRLAAMTGLPASTVVEACGLDPTLVPPRAAPTHDDPELALIAAAWPGLDDGLRRAIKVLAGAGGALTRRYGSADLTPAFA